MDPSQHLPEQLVVQTLFADGVIRYRVARPGAPAAGPGLELVASREEILPDTEAEMSWMASDFGMQMTLSRKVPDHIRAAPGGASWTGWARTPAWPPRIWRNGPSSPSIPAARGSSTRSPSTWAWAGAGPGQQRHPRDNGNMSSATLPHMWKAMLDDERSGPARWSSPWPSARG